MVEFMCFTVVVNNSGFERSVDDCEIETLLHFFRRGSGLFRDADFLGLIERLLIK